MIKTFLLLLGGILYYSQSTAQDSITMHSNFDIEIRGQHNLAAFVDNKECYNCIGDEIEDNPFHHLAVYAGINHTLTLNNKIKLGTGLYLEERSYSGGNNTLANLIVFPKILLEVSEDIFLGNDTLNIDFKGGDFWNEDVQDIIRLENIDYQGLIAKFKYKKTSLSLFTIGDLSYNVGLNWPQLYRMSITYENNNFINALHWSYNELSTSFNNESETDHSFSNYSKLTLHETFNIETQIGIRTNRDFDTGLAFVFKTNYSTKPFDFSFAIRYFNEEYNERHDGNLPRYATNSAYISRQLYPLKNFYRHFSQWAVYTHRQNQDLLAVAFTLSKEGQLHKKMFVFIDLDINYIKNISDDDSSIFPIAEMGLRIKFLDSVTARLGLSNKHMELEDDYQTFSVSKRPYVSLGFNVELYNLGNGEKVLRY